MADHRVVRLSIGRADSCDIRVDDRYASPLHATLVLHADGRMLVQDEGSTNGTRVSGQGRVYGPSPVGAANTITVGRTDLLVADLVAAAARIESARRQGADRG